MRYALLLVPTCWLLCAGPCSAQTFPPDTDSYNDAIASMQVVARMTGLLTRECGARVPALKSEVDDASAAWLAANRRAIDRADAYWKTLSKDDPRGANGLLDDIDAKVGATIRQLAGAPPDVTPPPLYAYCKRFFDQLGGWRGRTPRLHAILDKEI